jgi:short-subunit dehydrogenase
MALCPGPVPTGFQSVAGAGIAPSQKRAILSAEETVRRGIAAYERQAAVYIPGALNRLGAFGSRLLPRALVVRTVGSMMKDKASSS